MDIARHIFLFFHFVGYATLLVGIALSARAAIKGLNRLTLIGALTQLVTGLVLVTLAEMNPDREVNHAKVGVKLALLIVIAVITVVFGKRELPKWVIPTLAALTIVEVGVAVFW